MSQIFVVPFLKALKDHYSDIVLGDASNGTPVGCKLKTPQKGFVDLAYPGVGIEYVTGVLDRGRTTKTRVTKNLETNTANIKRALEPLTFLVYAHTFVQDDAGGQRTDQLLQQKMIQKTPFTFALEAELTDGPTRFEIYREDIVDVTIEGYEREIHNAYQLKVWGWLDPDPIGLEAKLVTDIDLRMYLGLDLA
jgi:hypothetical protein